MITVEIRVNGSLIAAANVSNTGEMKGQHYLYDVQAAEWPLRGNGPITHSSQLYHERSAGAIVLIQEVLKSMIEGEDE